jgi:hypothetical protein
MAWIRTIAFGEGAGAQVLVENAALACHFAVRASSESHYPRALARRHRRPRSAGVAQRHAILPGRHQVIGKWN